MSQASRSRPGPCVLDDAGLEWELGGRPGECVVTLPGDKKLRTVAAPGRDRQSLSVSAFVVRNPDENHEAFYRYLLRRNLRLPGLAYAIDKTGDVYVIGRVPLAGVDADVPRPDPRGRARRGRRGLQRAAGAGLPRVDEEGVGLAGLPGGVTRNLQAFAHLLEPSGAQPDGGEPDGGERATTPDGEQPGCGARGWSSAGAPAERQRCVLDSRHDLHPGPAPPRRERLERQEPLHRLGRRRPDRQGPRRGRARRRAAQGAGVLPDVVHTSLLRRAITTANLALDEADRHWIPVRRDWRLNERHYGALQGKDKKADPGGVRRGAVHALAPLVRHPAAADRRRRRVLPGRRPALRRPRRRCPATECLKDVVDRMLPVLGRRDRPRPAHRQDRAGRRPRQQPARAGQAPRRHQRRGHRGAQHPDRHPAGLPARRGPRARRPRGGQYLDPEAAADAIAAVANQGR